METIITGKEVAKALLDVQKKVYASNEFLEKTATNPFFKSKYLSLPELLKHIVPLLLEEGCVLSQHSVPSDRENSVRVVTCITEVESMTKAISWVDMPIAKMTPQEIGICITYGRRYGLEPLLGIPAVDDDGEGAMRREPKKQPERKKPQEIKKKKLTSTQRKRISEVGTKNGYSIDDMKTVIKGYGYADGSTEHVTPDDYEKIIADLSQPREEFKEEKKATASLDETEAISMKDISYLYELAIKRGRDKTYVDTVIKQHTKKDSSTDLTKGEYRLVYELIKGLPNAGGV